MRERMRSWLADALRALADVAAPAGTVGGAAASDDTPPSAAPPRPLPPRPDDRATLAALAREVAARAGRQADAIAEARRRVEALAGRSSEIQHVVELVDAIAAETHTLALNAAIEASRAGERGKGFGVVAEEVRRLADRSATATRDIGAFLDALADTTGEVVAALAALARDARDALDAVTGATSDAAAASAHAAAATTAAPVGDDRDAAAIAATRDAPTGAPPEDARRRPR